MAFFLRSGAPLMLTAALLLVPGVVCAQPPKPADQPPKPADPNPTPVQEPAPTPPDDGPKPAGVGTSQPPALEDASDFDPQEPLPPTSFPGVQPGTVPSDRPFSGLFGGAQPANRQNHSLTLSGQLFAAYSTNVEPQPVDGMADPNAGQKSTLAGGSGSVNYSHGWTSSSIGAHLNGSRSWVEAYESTGQEWLSRWDVGVNGAFSKRLSRNTQFGLRGAATYSPYLAFGAINFSSGSIGNLPVNTPGLDYALARDPSVLTAGGASLSYALNPKSSIDAYYDLTTQIFISSDAENFDRLDHSVGARYRYRFSRYAGLRAGYGYRRASVGGSDSSPITNHFIDVGLDGGYGKSYALTRRTTFSFSTDSSLFIDEGTTSGEENSFDPQTRVFVGGSADLTHGMGRTWAARIGYRRGVSYQPGFDLPVLSDSALASLGGLITQRLDFTASGMYSGGQVGFSGADNGFSTATAVASLRYAISSHLAAYTQYFYYHYLFQEGVTLPGYLQTNLDRQGVSVGLTAWLPLIGPRGRR